MKDFLKAPLSNVAAFLMIVAFVLVGLAGSSAGEGGLAALGATNFDTLQVGDGTASEPSLSFTDDTDTGFYRIGANNVGWAQGGTLAFDINSGGSVDFAGATNFTGAAAFSSTIGQTLVNAASGSANPYDYTGTLGIMNGSDDFTLFDVNITNANHTGSNTIQVLDIANITGDAEATETAINIGTGWDSALTIAGGGAIIGGDSQYRNAATGNVVLDFRDYADTADDDMAHAVLTTNCTDATTGAEDCDFTIGVVEAGAAAETRFNIDADGGATLGSANTNSITLTADSTGDGELTVPGESVSAAEILNVTRSIQLSLLDFIECDTDAGALIGFDANADAFPDYVNSGTDGVGFSLTFDDTGGSLDTAEVCTNFQVPQDYASGGSYRFSITKDGETTGTTTEILTVNANIAGGALATADSDNIVGAAEQEINSTPTVITYAAGDSVGMTFAITTGSAQDDTVNILSVTFEYVATQ